LMFDRLETNGNAHDSTALFSNTRTNANSISSIDNNLAGTGTTVAAIQTDVSAAITAMSEFTDDSGEVMEAAPDTFLVPPALLRVFLHALDDSRFDNQLGVVPNSTSRVYQAGGYTVISLARLSDADNWYALYTGGEVKPWLYSWITNPGVLNTPSMNDDTAVNHGFLRYAVRGNYVVAESLPHYFCLTTN